MSEARNPARLRAVLLVHLAAVLALMWPALLNRQPFFFSDTTSYIRAADLAVQLASGGRLTTAWTRPAASVAAAPTAPRSSATPGPVASPFARANEGGNVMSGRSPYFGAMLYAAYVTSDLWIFVIGQALVAYLLIGMALRRFGLAGARGHAATAALLAAITPLAYYDSLLLADALAGFGILAFLLLVADGGEATPWRRVFLAAVVLVSAVAHLTHIVMLFAMTLILLLLCAAGWRRWQEMRPALLVGGASVVIGLASVALTGAVVRHALGRAPVLVPLMTARFVADGPGRDFIAAGCGGRAFVVCRLPFGGVTSTDFLWSRDPSRGTYLIADPATRRRMSEEDSAFGVAVLRAYPLRQGAMMLRNTWAQLADFDSGIMNEECFAAPACSGDALPPAERARLRATPSGRGRWPIPLFTAVHYTAVLGALALLVLMLPRLLRAEPEMARKLLLWSALIAVAMLVNGFLGGAISEPQGRYQGRVIWLIPLLAVITGLRWRRLGSAGSEVPGRSFATMRR